MNINKFIGAGHITKDIEVRYSVKGVAVASFAVAVNRKWKGEDGQSKDEVTYINVTAFGKQAETINQYLKKGSPIYFEGRFHTESWEDKVSGQKRYASKILMESFQFVGFADRSGKENAPTKADESAKPKAVIDREDVPDDDDVPF